MTPVVTAARAEITGVEGQRDIFTLRNTFLNRNADSAMICFGVTAAGMIRFRRDGRRGAVLLSAMAPNMPIDFRRQAKR